MPMKNWKVEKMTAEANDVFTFTDPDTTLWLYPDGMLLLRSGTSESSFANLTHNGRAYKYAALSEDENQVIALDSENTVLLIDLDSMDESYRFPSHQIVDVAIPISESRYATIDRANNLHLWTIAGKESQLSHTFELDGFVSEWAFDSHSNLLMIRESLSMQIFDLARVELKDTYQILHTAGLASVTGAFALSQNGKYTFVYWDEGEIFETVTPKEIKTFAYVCDVDAVAVSNTAELYALGTVEGQIIVRTTDDRLDFKIAAGEASILRMNFNKPATHLGYVNEAGESGILDVQSQEIMLTGAQVRREFDNLSRAE